MSASGVLYSGLYDSTPFLFDITYLPHSHGFGYG